MAYLKPEDYKGQTYKYPYPVDQDPKKKKEESYYKRFCEAMMADYASGYCQIPLEFGTQRLISELRAYRQGKQGSEKIKKWLLGNKKNVDGKQGFVTKMNISWDVYQKLPQLFDQMRSKNMSQEYDVDLKCIDSDSVAARQATAEAIKFLIDENTKKFLAEAKYKPNFQPNPEELGLETNDDVDIWMETGGYMLEWEIAAKAACRKTKIASNYNMLQDETFDDLLTNPEGVSGWKVYIDESTQTPTIRKVNIQRAIIQYSDRPDFSDQVRGGEVRLMTIAEIRKECPWITEAQFRVMAKNFAWMNVNYDRYIRNTYGGYYGGLRQELSQSQNGYFSDPINRVKVLVLDAQWLSDDIETRVTNEFSNGGFLYKEVDFNYKPDAKSIKKGDRVIRKKTIRKYFAKWIIGTDHFLDYGVDNNNVYYGEDGNKTPKLDYFFVKTGNSSMVERCIALADEINMILVKHRNAWATLPAAPAMAIQKHLVENVFLNNKRQDPMDLIQGLIERGVFYYDGLDDHGDPKYQVGGQKPIDFMDISKMAGMLRVCSEEMAVKVNEMREVLGLQGGSDGGLMSPYQGLGQTRLAFEAANASLMPTFKAYHYLFKNAFDHVIKQWQIVANKKKTKIVANTLGEKNLKVLELGKDFSNADFNIEIAIAPTQDEKQFLLQEIGRLKDLGIQSQGMQGLLYSEYLFLYDKIMDGNITEAMYLMGKIEKKKLTKMALEKRQAQQDNVQANMVAAQTKGQQDMAITQMKGQTDIANTVVQELLKTNRDIVSKLISPLKEGESLNNQGLAMNQLKVNMDDVSAILNPEPEQTEMARNGAEYSGQQENQNQQIQ